MKWRNYLGMLATVAALPACSVDAGPSDVVVGGDGLLTVDWTIEDAKVNGDCSSEAADSIDIVVTTPSGAVVGDFNDPCEAFASSIELAPGTYFGDATLLDSNGRARTTPVDLGRFTIFGDDELVVPIDFPFDSFY